MKWLLVCLLSVLFISCGRSTQNLATEQPTMPDTVYIEVPKLNEERIKELEKDVEYWKGVVDSVQTVIPYEDYMNARRAEKIKYYISICEKNSNNKKFFFGWIKRTMSED